MNYSSTGSEHACVAVPDYRPSGPIVVAEERMQMKKHREGEGREIFIHLHRINIKERRGREKSGMPSATTLHFPLSPDLPRLVT